MSAGERPGMAAHATPYQQARDAGREALRQVVLRAAGDLLALEGPGALTMRRIADHIGASTTVIYSLFDGKSDILDALITEGDAALSARLAAIPSDQAPLARLAAAMTAYREAARDEPARYGLMFGGPGADHPPSQAACAAARSILDAVAAIVRECADAGELMPDAEAEFVAEVLIAAAHGAVSLELAGRFDNTVRADRRFADLTGAAIERFRRF